MTCCTIQQSASDEGVCQSGLAGAGFLVSCQCLGECSPIQYKKETRVIIRERRSDNIVAAHDSRVALGINSC